MIIDLVMALINVFYTLLALPVTALGNIDRQVMETLYVFSTKLTD